MKYDKRIINLNKKLNTFLKQSFINKGDIKSLVEHYKISGLYNYSFFNSALILLQGGHLAQSYKKWQTLGRYVKKGEKSNIMICIPMFEKVKELDSSGKIKEKCKLVYFGIGKVFDISQTEGKPLEYKHNTMNISSLQYEEVKEQMKEIVKRDIFEKELGTCRGYCSKNEIVIDDFNNNIDKIKTLIHECAHALLKHDENYSECSIKEIEAESVTYLVLEYLNIDYSLSSEYISNWANDSIIDNIDYRKIMKTSEIIIKSIINEK